MTDDIVARLRGRYPVGPMVNGEPEFGWRQFEGLPPIQAQAADEIERLRAEVARLRSLVGELRDELDRFARLFSGYQGLEWGQAHEAIAKADAALKETER